MCPANPRNPAPITKRWRRSQLWCRRASAATCAARNPALRYGLALNDRGYFWEAQEILEAVWAAAPQGGRERILLRACILIATANLRLRMQKAHVATRLFGEALGEFEALGMRSAGGDGFADSFPVAALAARIKAKLALPMLTKADWVAFGAAART
ncbi:MULTISPECIES: DUF309 domain-containing protein [unclassified Bradyrhizobium]|uniref:DUF309 domain-containing protein n=1 Tax=unclassified Bradyrhizobium TaxID=2631580 RepID=UPI002FF05C4E